MLPGEVVSLSGSVYPARRAVPVADLYFCPDRQASAVAAGPGVPTHIAIKVESLSLGIG